MRSMDYPCWEPDYADEIVVMPGCYGMEDAADDFAKHVYDNSAGECGREFEVVVKHPTTGEIKTFKVEVEYEPTFHSVEKL